MKKYDCLLNWLSRTNRIQCLWKKFWESWSFLQSDIKSKHINIILQASRQNMRITPFSWVLRKFHKDFFLLYRYIYWVAIYHMHLLTSILCIATKYKYLTLFEEGGDNFVLHPKVIPITSFWLKLHKNVIRYVLEIYFLSIFQQNQNYQQVMWPPCDVIMEFAINSMVKLSQNQKCCNFVKNWFIRTKFYQEVHFKDCKWSEMNF